MLRGVPLLVTLGLLAAVPAAAKLPQWDERIDKSKRFTVLKSFDSAAARDDETGLVWDLSPFQGTTTWYGARFQCLRRVVGGRMGWRLPTAEEFLSLADATGANPVIPAGHPFSGNNQNFWTATSDDGDPRLAVAVRGDDFTVQIATKTVGGPAGYWCVRGGQGPDGQLEE